MDVRKWPEAFRTWLQGDLPEPEPATTGPVAVADYDPEDEGPPMELAIGRYRWVAEQAVVEVVDRLDALLAKGWNNTHGGGEVPLYERIDWARSQNLLTEEELEAWRAALRTRSEILADDRHTEKLKVLRLRASLANTACDRVAERVDALLSGGGQY